MGRFLGIVSGKGGVGKTTTSINLAFCLKDFYKTVLVEGNLQNPHIGLHFGQKKPEYTIHDATMLKHTIEKAIHDIYGMNVVMGSTGAKYNEDRIQKVIRGLYPFGETIIVDCPPGNYMQILEHCDECIIVTTPDPVSVSESYIAKGTAKKLGVIVLGVVINRASRSRHELGEKRISQFLNLPVLANIPEDKKVQEALSKKQPVVHYNPSAKSSREFIRLADSVR